MGGRMTSPASFLGRNRTMTAVRPGMAADDAPGELVTGTVPG